METPKRLTIVKQNGKYGVVVKVSGGYIVRYDIDVYENQGRTCLLEELSDNYEEAPDYKLININPNGTPIGDKIEEIRRVACNILDKMYTYGIPDEDQSTGYKIFKDLCIYDYVIDEVVLRNFHVNMRPFLPRVIEVIREKYKKPLQ